MTARIMRLVRRCTAAAVFLIGIVIGLGGAVLGAAVATTYLSYGPYRWVSGVEPHVVLWLFLFGPIGLVGGAVLGCRGAKLLVERALSIIPTE